MKLTPARDKEGVRTVRLLHPETHIGLKLLEEPLPEFPRRAVLALAPGERRSIDRKGHAEGRLVHLDAGERRGVQLVRDRFADVDIGNTGNGNDLAGFSPFHFNSLQSLKHEQSDDFALLVLVLA